MKHYGLGEEVAFGFNAGKTQLVSFGQSQSTGAIDMKMDESVLEEESSFTILGLAFCSKLDWIASLLLRLSPRKLQP